MTLVQELAPKILAEVEKAQSILLHFHPSPDPDSVGSGLAMMHVLKGIGKKVTVIKGDSDIPSEFSFFPGIDQVLMKNWHEITPVDYDLLIVQDATIARVSRIVDVTLPLEMKAVVIDHHVSNPGGGVIDLIDTAYPSTCEILYDLFNEWKVSITLEIAHCLIIGMYTDTGGFRHDSTRPYSLTVAGNLAAIYPQYTKSLARLFNSHTKASILFQGLALSSLKEYEGGLVVSAVSYDDLMKHGITENDTSAGDIAQTLKSAVGWNVGVSAIEMSPGKVKMSLRTRDSENFDLSVLAGKLGGGGHKGAAGVYIEKPLAEAVQIFVDTFNMYRTEKGL